MQSIWWQRLASFALWGLAAGCAVFWALRFAASPSVAVPIAAAGSGEQGANPRVDTALVAQLLGAKGASNKIANNDGLTLTLPKIASKYTLTGLVAAGKASVALIAFDGKPARPYRVGALVDEGLVLQSVGLRSVSLGASRSAPASVTLELPSKPGPVVVSAFLPPSAPPVSPVHQTFAPQPVVIAPPVPGQVFSQVLSEVGIAASAANDPVASLQKATRMRGLGGSALPPPADGAAPADPARN